MRSKLSKGRCGLIVLVLLWAGPLVAGVASWDAYVRAFDTYVADHGVVGASTVCVREGQIASRHQVGLADRERRQRVDLDSLFHYGSITKTLAAITVLQLRDRGRLSLDDPVTKYLPELRRLNNPYGPIEQVTLRTLLAHTSGLQNPTWPWKKGESWEPFEPTSWEQLVAMLPYQKLAFKPGTKFSYSNPAFIYLARVVEVITGDSWLVYVQKNVFNPLGMDRSYFSATPYYLADHRSNNYTVRKAADRSSETVANGRDFDPGITNPNGGWNAPLEDVAKYVAFLTGAKGAVNAANFDHVLSRSSLSEAWRPVIETDAPPERQSSMGLTFFILKRGKKSFIGHTGSQAGFLAYLYCDPESRAGVVAAFNTHNEIKPPDGFRALCEEALRLLGEEK